MTHYLGEHNGINYCDGTGNGDSIVEEIGYGVGYGQDHGNGVGYGYEGYLESEQVEWYACSGYGSSDYAYGGSGLSNEPDT